MFHEDGMVIFCSGEMEEVNKLFTMKRAELQDRSVEHVRLIRIIPCKKSLALGLDPGQKPVHWCWMSAVC